MTQLSTNQIGGTQASPHAGHWSLQLILRIVVLIMAGEVAFLVFAYPSNALTQIGTAFRTDQTAWLQTAFALTGSVASPLIGKLADRHGKRKVLIATLTVTLVGLAVSSVAPSFGVLIAGRSLQGVALALPFLLPSLVRDLFPRKTLAIATSLASTGSGVLSIGFSFLVAPVILHLGFRGTFWIPAVACAVMIAVVRLVVPESPVRSHEKGFDVLGAVLLGGGLAGVLLTVSLGSTWGWTSATTFGTGAGGLVLLAAWVIQALRAKFPLIRIREFKRFPFTATVLFSFLGTTAATFFYIFMATVILTPASAGLGYGLSQSVHGYSLIGATFTGGVFIGGVIAGPLLNRLSAPIVAIAAQIVAFVGAVTAIGGVNSMPIFTLAAALTGLSLGLNTSTAYNLVALVVAQRVQASMASVVAVGNNVGSAILPVVVFAYLNGTALHVAGATVYTVRGVHVALGVGAAIAIVLLACAIALVTIQRKYGGLRMAETKDSPQRINLIEDQEVATNQSVRSRA